MSANSNVSLNASDALKEKRSSVPTNSPDMVSMTLNSIELKLMTTCHKYKSSTSLMLRVAAKSPIIDGSWGTSGCEGETRMASALGCLEINLVCFLMLGRNFEY